MINFIVPGAERIPFQLDIEVAGTGDPAEVATQRQSLRWCPVQGVSQRLDAVRVSHRSEDIHKPLRIPGVSELLLIAIPDVDRRAAID
jgi:hypothetical protein